MGVAGAMGPGRGGVEDVEEWSEEESSVEVGRRSVCRVGECVEKERKEVVLRVRSCPRCPVLGNDPSVRGWMDRDVNGAANIREVVLHYAEHGVRPSWNVPQHRGRVEGKDQRQC